MQQARQLYKLQEIDWKIAAAEKSLSEVRAKLADEAPVLSARSELESVTARLDELTAQRTAVDHKVEELQEQLKRLESRLYGGFISSPKEASAAEEEREYTTSQQRDEEDRLLELMVNVEDLQEERNLAETTVERLEAARPAEKAELRGSRDGLEGEVAGLSTRRGQIVPLVPADLLYLYDSLREAKGGHAVAKVERGMCQGCRVALSQAELQRVRSPSGVVQCDSCRRILFLS